MTVMPEFLGAAADKAGLLAYLADPDVREVLVTSTGACFVVSTQQGFLGRPPMDLAALDTFLAILAFHHGALWSATSPQLAVGDPSLGFRIEASRYPVSPGTTMVLRKHPAHVYPLDDFEKKGIITSEQRTWLVSLLRARKTVFIAGETGSGKTSLLNACVHELRDLRERWVIIEGQREVVCDAAAVVWQTAVPHQGITIRDLCRNMLRYTPDRIVIGEVRGGEALDALVAFQTGHAGLCTVHAKSAEATLQILEQRVGEASQMPQQALIGQAVDVIVHMEQMGRLFRVTEMLGVEGWTQERGYELREIG